MALVPSSSFYEAIGRIEAAIILTVITTAVIIHVLTWGVESCCEHIAKAVTSIRKLKGKL